MKSLCLLTPSSREGTDESSLSGTSWQPVSTSISGALSECTGDPHGVGGDGCQRGHRWHGMCDIGTGEVRLGGVTTEALGNAGAPTRHVP